MTKRREPNDLSASEMANEGARKELEGYSSAFAMRDELKAQEEEAERRRTREQRRMTQDEAEKLVAGILQRFEKSSGDLVESVELRNVNVTRIDDTRPRWMTQVVIRTRRTPGRDWVIDHAPT